MSFGEAIAPFLGRVIMAWFFFSEAYRRALDWDTSVSLLALQHVPVPPLVLFAVLTVMFLGALSLFLGFRTRLGAAALFAVVLISTALSHDYWNIANAIDRQADYDIFARNIAIAGGLLFLMGMGPGPFALERGKGGRR